MSSIFVSIVVCTFNRAAMLREALTSLVRQQFSAGDWEIVVIDNGSTDETAATLAELSAASAIPIRPFLEKRPGVACARNRGLLEARGTWIAFFDDDQVAASDWLRQLIETARAKKASCVGGAVKLLLDDSQLRQLPTICRQALGATVALEHEQPYAGEMMPGTGNLLLHRDVIARVGNFDETLVEAGEDSDLFRRIRAAGYAAWFTPQAIVQHQVPADRLQPSYFFWTSRRGGWIRARGDVVQRGIPRALMLCAARGLQAVLVNVPRLIAAKLRGRTVDTLGATCALLRFEGYCRSTLHHFLPRTFPSKTFRAAHSFRAERAPTTTDRKVNSPSFQGAAPTVSPHSIAAPTAAPARTLARLDEGVS